MTVVQFVLIVGIVTRGTSQLVTKRITNKHLFTDAIVKAMIPLFERFGSTELLGGVTQCLNQSNNESFNHLMWNLALSD